jgi:hypothetical protein
VRGPEFAVAKAEDLILAIRDALAAEVHRAGIRPSCECGGTPFFPDLARPAGLRLLETRTFSSGVVYLGYAAR